MSDWIFMEEQKPPYCESPTWFEVIIKDSVIRDNKWLSHIKLGEVIHLCRWWDHWYQSVIFNDDDVLVWRSIVE